MLGAQNLEEDWELILLLLESPDKSEETILEEPIIVVLRENREPVLDMTHKVLEE